MPYFHLIGLPDSKQTSSYGTEMTFEFLFAVPNSQNAMENNHTPIFLCHRLWNREHKTILCGSEQI